jgi:hypothetical protein
MVISHSYVKLPEGTIPQRWSLKIDTWPCGSRPTWQGLCLCWKDGFSGCDWDTGMVQSSGKFVGPLMLLYVPSIASDPRVTLVLDLVNISQSQNGEGYHAGKQTTT